MTYKIYADGVLVYSSIASSDVPLVTEPKMKLEMGKAGAVDFTLLPSHPMYNSLHEMTTVVTVYIDDEEMFRGRVNKVEEDFFKQRKVTCEGDLAYLLDSVVMKRRFTGSNEITPVAFLDVCLGYHNDQVEAWKRLYRGNVTIDEANTVDRFEVSSPQQTASVIESDMVNVYGGFLKTRHSSQDGKTYIDYVKEYDITATQPVKFGWNMISMDRTRDAKDLYTVLMPVGDNDTLISSVNNNSPFLPVSSALVQEHGTIIKTHSFSGTSSPSALKTKAEKYIRDNTIGLEETFKIKAIDMHMIDGTVDMIRIGSKVTIVSEPHGIDVEKDCISIEYDLVNADQNSYEFGVAPQTKEQKERRSSSSLTGGISTVAEQAVEESTKKIYDAYIKADPDAGTVSLYALYNQYENDLLVLKDEVGIDLKANPGSIIIYNRETSGGQTVNTELGVLKGMIDSKVDNGIYRTYVEQTATQIASKVDYTTYNSYVLQTGNQISAVVSQTSGLSVFDKEQPYAIGAQVIHNNLWYEFTAAHTAGDDWDPTKVRQITSLLSRIEEQSDSIELLTTKTGIDQVTGQGVTLYSLYRQNAGLIEQKVDSGVYEAYTTLTDNKINVVVGTNNDGNYFKAAELAISIVDGINGKAEGLALLNASKVLINADRSIKLGDLITIDSNGYTRFSGFNMFVGSGNNRVSINNGEVIANNYQLSSGGAFTFVGSSSGEVYKFNVSGTGSYTTSIKNIVTGITLDQPTAGSNTYTLKMHTVGVPAGTTIGTFSRATQLGGQWGGSTLTVTATPQNQTYVTELTVGPGSWVNGSMTITPMAQEKVNGSAVGEPDSLTSFDVTIPDVDLDQNDKQYTYSYIQDGKKLSVSFGVGGRRFTFGDVPAIDAYKHGWSSACGEVSLPNTGTGSSIAFGYPKYDTTLTDPCTSDTFTLSLGTVENGLTYTGTVQATSGGSTYGRVQFTLSADETPTSSGYVYAKDGTKTMARLPIGNWYTNGYNAGWGAANTAVVGSLPVMQNTSASSIDIPYPSATVDSLATRTYSLDVTNDYVSIKTRVGARDVIVARTANTGYSSGGSHTSAAWSGYTFSAVTASGYTASTVLTPSQSIWVNGSKTVSLSTLTTKDDVQDDDPVALTPITVSMDTPSYSTPTYTASTNKYSLNYTVCGSTQTYDFTATEAKNAGSAAVGIGSPAWTEYSGNMPYQNTVKVSTTGRKNTNGESDDLDTTMFLSLTQTEWSGGTAKVRLFDGSQNRLELGITAPAVTQRTASGISNVALGLYDPEETTVEGTATVAYNNGDSTTNVPITINTSDLIVSTDGHVVKGNWSNGSNTFSLASGAGSSSQSVLLSLSTVTGSTLDKADISVNDGDSSTGVSTTLYIRHVGNYACITKTSSTPSSTSDSNIIAKLYKEPRTVSSIGTVTLSASDAGSTVTKSNIPISYSDTATGTTSVTVDATAITSQSVVPVLTGGWENGTFTVTSDPEGNVVTTSPTISLGSWVGGSMALTLVETGSGGASTSTGVTNSVSIPSTATFTSGSETSEGVFSVSFSIGGASRTVSGSINAGYSYASGFNLCHDSIALSASSQTLSAGSSVTVYPKAKASTSASSATNITAKGITITAPSFTTEEKSRTITSNGTYTFTPGSGKDGLSKVTITVNVSSGGGQTTIPNTTTIYSTEEAEDFPYQWLPVKYGDETGYVKAEFIKKTEMYKYMTYTYPGAPTPSGSYSNPCVVDTSAHGTGGPLILRSSPTA